MQKSTKIILGIDPGTIAMGYGVISITGNELTLVTSGVLRLSSKDDAYVRLQKIHEKVTAILTKFKPQHFAIEAPFFGKNVQSMLKLGRAQGVAIAAAMQTNIPVTEYAPRKIKQSITGNGNAGKEQVLKMLEQILNFKDVRISLDASDALAVAVCHHYQARLPTASSKSGKTGGWEDFLKQNPGRVM